MNRSITPVRYRLAVLLAVLVCVPLACPATAHAFHKRPGMGAPQGRTWDSIKRLPDWSGVWVLSDESWTAAIEAYRPAPAGSARGAEDEHAPLTPRYRALADQVMRGLAQAIQAPPDNETKCIPVGIPASTAIPIGHEYLFTPGRVTVIFENGTVRRIDTSGRPHPPAKELNPTFAGNSVGHWEGRTLVVDTIGFLPQAEFLGALHVTSRTHLTERIFRRDPDTLEIDAVIADPAIFTRPWAYRRLYKHSTLPPFEYYPCVEGSRDVMTNGQLTGVDLTPPR